MSEVPNAVSPILIGEGKSATKSSNSMIMVNSHTDFAYKCILLIF